MKIIIEHHLSTFGLDFKELDFLFKEYGRLLNYVSAFNITSVECYLPNLMKNFNPKYFAYGFGSDHMWVHQKVGNEILPDRIIFVDFTA